MSGECKCGGQCGECWCENLKNIKFAGTDEEVVVGGGVYTFLDVEHEGLEKEGGGR